MGTESTTNGDRRVSRDGGRPPTSAALTPDPRPARAATVTRARRRAAGIVCGDVIALPGDVFHPVPACRGGRRSWMWRAKPWRLITNPHRWRLVCETDHLDGDEAALAASVPLGLRVMRICDEHPDQGGQYQTRVIAVREHDLIDVQVPTEVHAPRPDAGRE